MATLITRHSHTMVATITRRGLLGGFVSSLAGLPLSEAFGEDHDMTPEISCSEEDENPSKSGTRSVSDVAENALQENEHESLDSISEPPSTFREWEEGYLRSFQYAFADSPSGLRRAVSRFYRDLTPARRRHIDRGLRANARNRQDIRRNSTEATCEYYC